MRLDWKTVRVRIHYSFFLVNKYLRLVVHIPIKKNIFTRGRQSSQFKKVPVTSIIKFNNNSNNLNTILVARDLQLFLWYLPGNVNLGRRIA